VHLRVYLKFTSSTSNMVISFLPLLPQVLGFGMESKQLFPSLLKVLVFYLASSLLYLFGLPPGFLLFLPFSLIPVCLICPPLIPCLSLIFFSPPLPIGIPHCYFFFLNLQPLLKYWKLFPPFYMIRFFGLPPPLDLSPQNQSITLSLPQPRPPLLLFPNLIGKLYGN
jgi:hypothetical protein